MRYNRNRRPLRDREAEVPRLHRGRRVRDREAIDGAGVGAGPRGRNMGRGMDRDQDRDRFVQEDEQDLEPRRPRRSRKYSRDVEAMLERRASERRALRDRVRDERGERGGRGERGMESRRPEPRRPMRSRDSAEDELLDLDSILEVPEDEIEEEFPPIGLDEEPIDEEPKEDVCPEGCVPEELVDEVLEEVEEEGAEDDKDKKDDEAAEDKEGEDDKDDDKDKDDKKEAAVALKVETAKWAPLFSEADIQKLDRTAEVVLVPFFQQQNPSYVVLANGRPVGEIRESDLDQVEPEDRHALFVAEAFPKGIVQGVEQLGASNVLGDLNLRYYANLVTQRQADSAAKNQVQADLEEAFQTRAASLKQDFINNVLLAVEASSKNIFLQNPLRDAVRESFRGAGVPDAIVVDLFEDAMQKAGPAYFGAMIEQANEWLGFEKEALAQIESTIRESGYSHPADRGMPIEADVVGPPTAGPGGAPARPIPRTMQPAPQRNAAPNEWDGAEADVKTILRQAGSLTRGR